VPWLPISLDVSEAVQARFLNTVYTVRYGRLELPSAPTSYSGARACIYMCGDLHANSRGFLFFELTSSIYVELTSSIYVELEWRVFGNCISGYLETVFQGIWKLYFETDSICANSYRSVFST
jgi:hypothetical protein